MNNTHIVRESMVFYRSFFESVQTLPDDVFKKCVCDILNYGLNGEMPQSDGMEKAIFTLVKAQIDKNNQRWLNSKKSHGAVSSAQAVPSKIDSSKSSVETVETSETSETAETISEAESETKIEEKAEKKSECQPKKKNVFYPVPDKVLFSQIPPEREDFSRPENGSLDADNYKDSIPVNDLKEAVGEYNNVFLSLKEKDMLIKILGLDTYLESVEHLSKYIKRKPLYSSACHYEDLGGWVQNALKNQRNCQQPKKDDPFFGLNLEDFYEKP